MIFTKQENVVWAPAEEFYTYHIPAPTGRNQRFVGIVRGRVHSRAAAAAAHNAFVSKMTNEARLAGNLTHEAYFRLAPPGAPEGLEFLGLDTWFDGEGMGRYYERPELMQGLMEMFAEEPSATVWVHPGGEWVEW